MVQIYSLFFEIFIFSKDRKIMITLLKWSSLQKSIRKFTPKKLNEIDPWFFALLEHFAICKLRMEMWFSEFRKKFISWYLIRKEREHVDSALNPVGRRGRCYRIFFVIFKDLKNVQVLVSKMSGSPTVMLTPRHSAQRHSAQWQFCNAECHYAECHL